MWNELAWEKVSKNTSQGYSSEATWFVDVKVLWRTEEMKEVY